LYYWLKAEKNRSSAFVIPSSQAFLKSPQTLKHKILGWLPYLRALALSLIIIALARPQSPSGLETIDNEGIDIVLATDVSGSMQERDFAPNRLEAAKNVALDFIDHRAGDRIGLVVFSGESFTLCPITTDHNVLKDMLANAGPGMLQDGTAIGMGLATSADRLRESKAKSKVIILLTDGINNAGIIDPVTAAEIAHKFNIKVYTIGMSANLEEIDDSLMTKVANITGGKFYRATNGRKLYDIYAEIDRLEKSKVESARYLPKTEEFYIWLWLALALISLEFVLRYTYLKSVN
jgi:Ca-activated chloride channel family protein